MWDFSLDPHDDTPLYKQVVRRLRRMIAMGILKPKDEVLPIRSLAAKNRINPNTIVRAYQELEEEGLFVKRSTAGTYVSDEAASLLAGEDPKRELLIRIDGVLKEARELSVGFTELLKLLLERSEHMGKAVNKE